MTAERLAHDVLSVARPESRVGVMLVVGALTLQQSEFLVILVVAFVLLITERLRNDVTALLIVLALAVSGVLTPQEALAGFSSEPAIVVAAIFVLSAGLHQTGVSEMIGRWIGRLAGSSYSRIVAVTMPSVALLSAFTHHVTTTAVMLPVMLDVSREHDIAPSRLLMPLSFAASLGTTITIIGAPAFLIASNVLQQAGAAGLGVFSIAPIGLAISAVGTLFTLTVGRILLPSRKGTEDPSNRFRLDEYFTELTILPDSPFLGHTISEIEKGDEYEFSVAGLVRDGRRVAPPYAARTVRAGDVVLIRTTPEAMVAIRQESGVELTPVTQYGEHAGNDHEGDIAETLVQAVLAPGSDLAGRTLSQIDFRRRYGAIVVGLWRRSGWLVQELAQTKLRAGDALVLQGDDESLARVASDHSFLMVVPFQGEARLRRRAPLAIVIMLATIVAAATNVLSLEIAALAGAVAMVLARCLTPRQAYHAVDTRIFVFIAGAIPLGDAMQKTGTSKLMAGWLQGATAGWSDLLILGVLFAIVAVLTQFMSDSATTALFGPVAAALAQATGHAPEAYVVTVAMASVASFLTPIGHHGNLLIYSPGGYRFSDFVRVGAPLTILVGVVVVLVARLVWPG